MHAKPDLRVFLKWMIARSGSVITDVILLGGTMRRFKLSLSSFLLIILCLMLLAIAIFERNRAIKIESAAIITDNAELKALATQEWEIVKRELSVQYALSKLSTTKTLTNAETDRSNDDSIANRRQLANIRNAQLKLQREKGILESMRFDIVQDMLDSND